MAGGMNVSKAIEQAVSELLRDEAELGAGVTVRAWQSLAQDPNWKAEPDKAFPLIDVRCSAPAVDQAQSTLAVTCGILCATKTQDDKDHAIVSAMYGEVERVIFALFSAFRRGDDEDEVYSAFLARIIALVDNASAFSFGGFQIGEASPPSDDNGASIIGMSLIVNYSWLDF